MIVTGFGVALGALAGLIQVISLRRVASASSAPAMAGAPLRLLFVAVCLVAAARWGQLPYAAVGWAAAFYCGSLFFARSNSWK